MRLQNYTNIPNDKIRQMISFVRPAGISNFDVRISNSKTSVYRGISYYNGAYCYATTNPFIVVRVARNENYFPIYTIHKKGKGYIDHLLFSRVILLLPHELRHLWHKKIPRGYSRPKFSTDDTNYIKISEAAN